MLRENTNNSERDLGFQVRDLGVTYAGEDGAVSPLRGIDLDVPAGQFLCLIGPSGGGKTTLLRCLAGLLMPTSGTVVAHGEPVTGPGADRGMVFQQDAIPLWRRVRSNVAFGLELRGIPKAERDPVVDHYLEAVGLKRFERAWPRQLSGGMRKRVAVAAVFANNPEALLMDEPFGSVDYFTRANLHDTLLSLWEDTKKTIVFVTHDVDETIVLGDRIVVLKDSGICADVGVPFARPRTEELRGDERAIELRQRLLALLSDTRELEIAGP